MHVVHCDGLEGGFTKRLTRAMHVMTPGMRVVMPQLMLKPAPINSGTLSIVYVYCC